MPTLLCFVGSAWQILPEAMHVLRNGTFDAVHVLTSASSRLNAGIDEITNYLSRQPLREFSISRTRDFSELRDEHDHWHFEELLFRWLLNKCPDRRQRYICLTGGYKTVAAAIQRAAWLFGAAEVFHVLCPPIFGENGNREAGTIEEIESAIAEDALYYIRLGSEPGWPQLVQIGPEDYPLLCEGSGPVFEITLPQTEQRLSQRVQEVLENSRRVSANWSLLEGLPFVTLAAWSKTDLGWLHEKLDPERDAAWVRRLPKIELHCHLGGFATHGPLLSQVRAAAELPEVIPPLQEPPLPSGWPLPDKPIGLSEYMKLGDANGRTLLRDPGCLRRQCELLYDAFVRDGVIYAEIRCSPANYANPDSGRSPWQVLCEIRESFQKAMQETPPETRCHVNLIVIATRPTEGDRSLISRHLALAVAAADHWQSGCRVVGVDLAGFENPATRAELFTTDFEPAHRIGLGVTVHAGENDDVEGIWQAVFKLCARRLGHALRLEESADLLRAVVDRGIAVEMCPYANYQVRGYRIHSHNQTTDNDYLPTYPLQRYLESGVLVTVNTDNLGISAATLSDNLLLCARLNPGLRRIDVLQLQANAARAAFVFPQERKDLVTRLSRIPPPNHS